MSSGVSDQMKVPGNTAKSIEERNIPWSQQVDEAINENLASPITDDTAAANQASMQFQYPPFNAKDTQSSWNNYKPRKPANSFESNKKYGKPAFFNSTKRDDTPQSNNAWGSHNARRIASDNASGNFNRSNRPDDAYSTEKLDNRPSANLNAADKKSSAPSATAAAPKKTTWASIASQPAKLTSRTTLTASSHKKKGPGMPPPPMVPGKHNLDVNTWDLPNNNPPPVPSPPPPIEPNYVETNPDFSVPIGSDYDLGARPEKGHKSIGAGGVGGGIDYPKDDSNKSSGYNSSNNFGRIRNSPNGHSRKNWSTQHPLHHNRQSTGGMSSGGGSGSGSGGGVGGGLGISGGNASNSGNGATGMSSGQMRRGEGSASGGSGGGGGFNRYSDRRGGHYGGSGSGGSVSGVHVGANIDSDSHTPHEYRDENCPRNAYASSSADELVTESPQAVLDELRDKNNYNPPELDLEKATAARFFVIKSYSEDDIHRSIKYEIWCSTDHGNKRLDDAFKERHKEGGNILLFFSVNGSGHFCGMAQMMTAVDYNSTSSVWSQDKWKGKFKVKWIYVKDVPNTKLRHIRLENNENKSVTNSRDTQEVPNCRGIEVLQILHSYKHTTSIFDDFYHYEKKQEEEVSSKKPLGHDALGVAQAQSPLGRYYGRQNDDRDRDRDRERERDRDRDGRGSGGSQKYFPGGGNGSGSGGGVGGGASIGGGSGGSNFRDRNNSYRGGYHNNYQDHRRYDSHRTGGPTDYQQLRDRDADLERENSDYSGGRHAQKFDYNRVQSKHNNRERDFNDDYNKGDSHFRTGSRELQKDNEYSTVERVRGTDY